MCVLSAEILSAVRAPESDRDLDCGLALRLGLALALGELDDLDELDSPAILAVASESIE